MSQNTNNTSKQNSQKPKVLLHNTNETIRDRRPQEAAKTPPHIQEMLHQREVSQSRVQEFYNARYNELHHVYSQKDKWAQQEIEKVRLELKQLAKKIDHFNKEVYQATLAPIVISKNKVYYKSFFDHIKEVIEMLKTQVDDAGSWLAMYRRRCKGKGAYMQGMKKQGAQYMFSEERGLATSIG
jgi:hypothetical protein